MRTKSRTNIPPTHLDCREGIDVDVEKGTSQVVLVGVYVIFATEEEPEGSVVSIVRFLGGKYFFRDTIGDGCVCVFIVNLCCQHR
jgi:hypothetical protein